MNNLLLRYDGCLSLIKFLLGRQNALALVCLELCGKFLVSSGHDSGVALHLISRLQGKK